MLYTSPAPSTAPGSHFIAHQSHSQVPRYIPQLQTSPLTSSVPSYSFQSHPNSHSSPAPSYSSSPVSSYLLFIPTTQFQDSISWLPSHIPQHGAVAHHPTSSTSFQSGTLYSYIALQVHSSQFQSPVPASWLGSLAPPHSAVPGFHFTTGSHFITPQHHPTLCTSPQSCNII